MLRCLYNVDSHALPKEWLPGGELFDKLLERDLVMNVQCGGQWGSFRHGPHITGNLIVMSYNLKL